MMIRDEILRLVNTPRIRLQLALALNCTEITIIRYIRLNDDKLTKAACLQIIKRETGLTDREILTERVASAASPRKIIPENEFYNIITGK